MKYMEVIINNDDIMFHYEKWKEDNKKVIHPLTVFLESVGLQYKRLYRTTSWLCEVVDKPKYLIAKINYGI